MILATPVDELGRLFDFEERPNLGPRYNLAPTQDLPIIISGDIGRHLKIARWGLVPSWARDEKSSAKMINARAETVAEKPAFRSAFRKRRCLIPADGFYEWKATGTKRKQPYLIRRRDKRPFAFAGLWETWFGPKGTSPIEPPLVSATVITTAANTTVAFLHDRMPVILDPSDHSGWLDPATPDTQAAGMLRPCPDHWLEAFAVGQQVGNPRYDGPDCVEPIPEQQVLL